MTTDEQRWILLRTFYTSYRSFHDLFDQYERRVLAFAESYGVDRKQLQLPPQELASLIDPAAIERLRDEELSVLLGIARRLFNTAIEPDPFGTHVTNIYHEVSILREEHRSISQDAMRVDQTEYERFYREVNIYYPRRLRHVRNLYGKAKWRLEQLLRTMSRNQIIVRSVYLFGERLVRGVYKGGLAELYRFLYPNGGALLGYTLAADSFLDSGFGAQAIQAYDRAIEALDTEVARKERTGARSRELESLQARRTNLEQRRDQALVMG